MAVVLEDESLRLAFFQNEFGGDAAWAVELERDVGGESEMRVVAAEASATVDDLDLMRLPAIVEGAAADGREADGAANAADSAVELMIERGVGVGGETDGHEIFQFDDAVFVRETCDENVCGGPVKLLAANLVGDGGDLEVAAFGVVEDRAENAWGIEVGRAVPIDGTVHPDEGDGAHVADDSVVFDWLVGHANFLQSRMVSSYTGAVPPLMLKTGANPGDLPDSKCRIRSLDHFKDIVPYTIFAKTSPQANAEEGTDNEIFRKSFLQLRKYCDGLSGKNQSYDRRRLHQLRSRPETVPTCQCTSPRS